MVPSADPIRSMVRLLAMAAVKPEMITMAVNIQTMATMRPPVLCGALSP